MKLTILTALVALSSLLTASVSYGWDSETRNGVRDMPIVRQKSFAFSPRPWVSHPYDSTEVFVTNLKDRVGGAKIVNARETPGVVELVSIV